MSKAIVVISIVFVLIIILFGLVAAVVISKTPAEVKVSLPTLVPTFEPLPEYLSTPPPDYYGVVRQSWVALGYPVSMDVDVYKVHIYPDNYYLVKGLVIKVVSNQDWCSLDYTKESGWVLHLTDTKGDKCRPK